MDDVTERWLPVVGWETKYEVSDLARVRSLPRMTATGRRGGKILAGVVDSTGAHVVVLHDSGRKRHVHIYRLVAEAFIGPQPVGTEVRHLDDNRLDSHLANLAYGTKSQNMVDAAWNGKFPGQKLTVKQVREIRQRVLTGATARLLAAEYGVCRGTIEAVVSRRNWKHVA